MKLGYLNLIMHCVPSLSNGYGLGEEVENVKSLYYRRTN